MRIKFTRSGSPPNASRWETFNVWRKDAERAVERLEAVDTCELPGWRPDSDSCLGCEDKELGRIQRVQRKGRYGTGVFVFRVCLACGHATCDDKSHAKSIGLWLTTETPPVKYQ